MATTLSHSESRRLYSWWWDSHIPKNSKWLKENLTDMDSKVKAMIKLIEEDADSFARRAEMYYKKRPELIKLVEEFYRAYRALAERYDHATVELRQAHRTMVEVLPNQSPCVMGKDSNPGTSSPNSESLLDSDVLPTEPWELSSADLNSREYSQAEVQVLQKILVEIQAEKEAVFQQYQLSLQRLSSLEKELKDAGGLDERASRAEIEIKVLKETLAKLEAEKNANLRQYNNCLEKLSSLENLVSKTEYENEGLKSELSGLSAENEAILVRYHQCLEMISILQGKISAAEENARVLNDQTEKAEAEVEALKHGLSRLKEEKEGAELQYEICLRRIAELESEISIANEDVKRLNIEVETGAFKLKCVEEERDLLEKTNQSLQLAAGDLAQKIANKDQEVLQKGKELGALQTLLQDEQSRFVEAEATLNSLQKLHTQSQEEQKALALELDSKLQTLKDLEMCNHDLQGDLRQAKEENQTLMELNSSSNIKVENLQNEICILKESKGKLEEDLAIQLAQSNSLHQEILRLKEEIERLNRRYQALIEQLCSVGLDPESVVASLRNMQDENLKLKETCRKDSDEKNVLHEKLKEVNKILENNAALESSLSGLNSKLEGSGKRIRELKESCQLLREEKSGIGAEKAILLSQLQMMTENMQKLFERSALAENSLSRANMELEGLRAKSKGLEEFCQMLKDEKSTLLQERSNLLTQLQNVEIRLGNLERRFSKLEEKSNDLERDKDSTILQVKELQVFLGIEKQERASYAQLSEFRLADLEKQVHLLQEERRLSKKEFEEELDRVVNAQVEIFVLQKFIEDLEQKNLSLLFECQKSNKLMAEFETESLEQQVEIEFLLDEIEKLRKGINQLFRALQVNPVMKHNAKFDEEQIPFGHMLDGVNNLKCSLLKNEDEKQQLAVENLVLSTFLYQLGLEGTQPNLVSKSLEQDMIRQVRILEKDKYKLLEMNKKLRVDANKQEKVLRSHLEGQHLNLVSLEDSYQALQEQNFQLVRQNSSLSQKVVDLEEKNGKLEEDYDGTLEEALTLGNLLTCFGNFRSEKAEEVKLLGEHVARVDFRNGYLKKEIETLEGKLETKDAESRTLNGKIEVLQQKLCEVGDLNDQLLCQIVVGKEFMAEQALKLVRAENKLQAAENLNAEYCCTIEELKSKCESSNVVKKDMEIQILTLSENFMKQKKEIKGLHKTNEDVLSKMGAMHLEIEEHRMKEENLTLELHERVNEFELWEAEASSFYFDLQACSIREVYLDNKVHELTSAWEHLEERNVMKDMEIERMKERFSFMESEIDGLKVQLFSYGPAIASLQKNVESLEHHILHANPSKGEDVMLQTPDLNHQELEESRCRAVTDGISDLQKMQARIGAVEKAMIEQASWLKAREVAVPELNAKTRQPTRNKVKLDAPSGEAELWELKDWLSHGDNSFRIEAKDALPRKGSEISQLKTAILMKDIPLDQMSDRSSRRRSKRNSTGSESAEDQMFELCEPIEPGFKQDPLSRSTRRKAVALLRSRSRRNVSQKKRDPPVASGLEKEVGVDRLEVPRYSAEERYRDRNRRKILERIESDAKKLMSVQLTVQELKSKMEMKKSKKVNNNDESEKVKRRLLEVDEAILQLFSATNQLARDIQETPSSPAKSSSVDLEESDSTINRRVTERARKGSEKIGRLQFEVESIRYNILQLEDDNKSKGKHRFPGSRTRIILRDFVYSSRRNSIKRRNNNACFCGCGRPLTLEDEEARLAK